MCNLCPYLYVGSISCVSYFVTDNGLFNAFYLCANFQRILFVVVKISVAISSVADTQPIHSGKNTTGRRGKVGR